MQAHVQSDQLANHNGPTMDSYPSHAYSRHPSEQEAMIEPMSILAASLKSLYDAVDGAKTNKRQCR